MTTKIRCDYSNVNDRDFAMPVTETITDIQQRLEYLRGELRAERISYEELAELQSLAQHIDPSDVELLEAAGVPEFPDREQQEQDSYDYRNEQEAERFGNVPCVKCGRDDLPLHANRHCPECYSDDHAATARPWRVYVNDDEGVHILSGMDAGSETHIVCEHIDTEANAALIVRAVNSYDQNQQVIKALVDAAIQARNVLYDDDPATAKAIAMIDAALKLAGE